MLTGACVGAEGINEPQERDIKAPVRIAGLVERSLTWRLAS